MYRKIFDLTGGIPVLETNRLFLRRMLTRDYKDMYSYASDPRVSRHLLWNPHESESFTKKYLKHLQREYDRYLFYDWAVLCKDDGKMIGTCGLTAYSERHNIAEIGYVLNPAYWGRGIAAEAAGEVIRFAFDTVGVERVEARHMEGNEASGAVMQKCGLQKEGVLRHAVCKNGVYHNVHIYSILRSEYNRNRT